MVPLSCYSPHFQSPAPWTSSPEVASLCFIVFSVFFFLSWTCLKLLESLYSFIIHNVLWQSLPQINNMLWEKMFHSLLNLTPFGFTCCSLAPVHENSFFSFFPSCSWLYRFLLYSSLNVCFFDHSLFFLGEQSRKFELSCCHSKI